VIADEFHTYFCEQRSVLVHDATPVGQTFAILPGFTSAEVANAAEVAMAN